MTYFHRSNFRRFTVTPAVAPARKEPRLVAEIDPEFTIENEPADLGEGKTEKLVS